MKRPFQLRGGRVAVRLGERERRLLADLPVFLLMARDGDDAGAARLRYQAHPSDDDRQADFAAMTDSLLEEARRHDADRMAATLDDSDLDPGDAAAWARLIGEARLVIAARIGVTEAGWESDEDETPEMAFLHFLSWLQDNLVRALPVG